MPRPLRFLPASVAVQLTVSGIAVGDCDSVSGGNCSAVTLTENAFPARGPVVGFVAVDTPRRSGPSAARS
jgi:hypothetical protein